MDRIGRDITTDKPHVVYNKLLTAMNVCDAPKNLQQIYSKKYNDNKSNRSISGNAKNLANQLQQVVSMSRTESSIRSAVTNKDFGVVIYTDEQIADIKHFFVQVQLPLA